MSSPTALIDLPLYDMYWADQGSNLLTNGDFEGAAGPPPTGWTEGSCTATRQAGTRTNGTGSYVGQAAYLATATGGMSQNILTSGRRYRFSMWGYSDGTAVPGIYHSGTGWPWYGVASAGWQYSGELILNAAATDFRLWSAAQAPGTKVQFDDAVVYEQFMYTANRGVLGGKVQVGDGRTAASFPTMLNPTKTPRKGMSFDGGDYLIYPNVLANGTYTACFLAMRTTPGAFTGYLIDARAGGGTGYMYWDGAALASSSGTLYVNDTATTAMSYGQLSFVACSGITLNATTNIVFAAHNTLVGPWYGNIFGVQLYPGTLTPRQLSDVRQRMLSEVFK